MNDVLFYETVIKKEEPPYDFKIFLYLESKRDRRNEEQE